MEMQEHYDFVIIGSGFGGSVSALRLAQKGYRVAVLEEGRRFRDEDFAHSSWNVFKYLWQPALRCFGILRITQLDDVLILSGAGVGGGSLGYANVLLMPPKPFFEDPQWSDMAPWEEILSPHYQTARRMLGVTRSKSLTTSDRVLRAVAQELACDETFRLQDVGVYFGEPEKTVPDPYFDGRGPDRTGCSLCGGCMVGCRHNAKNTLVKNYLYLAEGLGVEIWPDTRATLIKEMPGGGYVVETRRTSSWVGRGRRQFKCRNLILSAGVLGTLNLLFRSRQAGTLKRLSPMLGARVRTNSEALTAVSARSDQIDYSQGIAITSSIYPDHVTHVEPVRYPKGSDLMSLLLTNLTEGRVGRSRIKEWLRAALRNPGQFLSVLWPFGWARRTIILLTMQTVDNSLRVRPQPRRWVVGNRLTSQREDGRQKVPVELAQAQTVTKAVGRKIQGAPQNAINEVFFNKGSTAHILGGCAIGPDPSKGVIDGHNRVYGYDGLYVVDGSMIPANLGVNPSLTITAMAEHAMSHIPNKTS